MIIFNLFICIMHKMSMSKNVIMFRSGTENIILKNILSNKMYKFTTVTTNKCVRNFACLPRFQKIINKM